MRVKNLIVTGQYLISLELSEDNLSRIKNLIIGLMYKKGYNPDESGAGYFTVLFRNELDRSRIQYSSMEKLLRYVKKSLGLYEPEDPRKIADAIDKQLINMVDDTPSEITFYITPSAEQKGFVVSVLSEPSLSIKMKRIMGFTPPSSKLVYDRIINSNKKFIRDIMVGLGASVLEEPHVISGEKLKDLEKDSKISILPEPLIIQLGKDFEIEIKDLRLNWGKSGTCTVFLLRKILEKLIFLTFAKNGMEDKFKDKNGNWLGLEAMINMASTCKVQGKPFLMPKTTDKIQGIKFLGDTAAHNPLINVDMDEIKLEMSFIITAYKELATKL